VSARADVAHQKMLQYFPMCKLPHGNAAFGERRLPVIAHVGGGCKTISGNDSNEEFFRDSLIFVIKKDFFAFFLQKIRICRS
jgi:hypothetical protein